MRHLTSLALMFVLATPAYAAFETTTTPSQQPVYTQGGFDGPGTQAQITQAAQVRNAADDATCMLQGRIVERITGKDDKYIFQDNSGRVIVEIDPEVFAGRRVTPQMLVRITGEVDKDLLKEGKVDVATLQILQ